MQREVLPRMQMRNLPLRFVRDLVRRGQGAVEDEAVARPLVRRGHHLDQGGVGSEARVEDARQAL